MATEKKEEEKPPVRVGVSTVLMNGKGEFLMGKRIGSHGASESPSFNFLFCFFFLSRISLS